MSTSEYKTPLEWLAEFHEAFGVEQYNEVNLITEEAIALRISLITEEFEEALYELVQAQLGKGDRKKIAKELADLVVVTVGTAEALSIDFDRVFDEVMKSNMSKLQEDGTCLRRADGKVLKGPNYALADLSFLLES